MRKYLKLIEKIEQINRQYHLSHYKVKLLNMVAKAYFANTQIFVGDLIHHKEIASPATLHASFKSLINKKLLATKYYMDDGRLKEILLTKAGLVHFKKLECALVEWVLQV